MGGRWRAASLLLGRVATASKSLTPNPSCPLRPLHFSLPSGPATHILSLRSFSAFPSRVSVDINEFDFVSPSVDQNNYEFSAMEDEETGKILVKAYFLCTRFATQIPFHGFSMRFWFLCGLSSWLKNVRSLAGIDIYSVTALMIHGFGSINLKSMQAENLSNVVPPTSRASNYIALRYCDFSSENTGLGVNRNLSSYRYMVVFQYGSAVLFNIEDHEAETYLDMARRHASGLLPEMRKDDYAVKVKPLLIEDMQGGPDYIVLKTLDTDGVRIIGSVLGQSIALDYFVSQVDGMVQEFAEINRGMEKTGTFTMDKKKLLQLVGKANSNLAAVILKVGLFERSEIAWRDAKYAQIYEYLREEYEVTQRFGNLDFKLKFVEHNIHFLQEVLQNRKSDLLEWCIIGLLTIENVISLYEIVRDSNAGPL
ncbi:Sporulation protein RMD1 [Morella rubra]|uniref:Sporulation protein RMD1 n=1 Tax=Morella rubra TaxID=262757 RepID=A0A6A1V6N1_9ROSI|nr:Sporulation protein RMD1 [Morella rubra]